MKQFYRSRYFAPLFFLLLNTALFWPFVFQGKIPVDPNPLYRTYPWKAFARPGSTHEVDPARDYHNIDTTLSFYPIKADLKQRMLRGDVPLWTDLLFCGSATPANHHVSSFDLLGIPLYVMPEFYAFGLILVLQFVLAGWFTFLFCEASGISRAGALLSGTAYMWNGYAFHWLGNISTNGTLLWLPLILYFLRRCWSETGLRPFHGLTFAVLAQYLGGFPQYWVYNLGVAGLYFVFLLVKSVRRRSRWGPFLLKSAAAVVLASALVAPLILLFSVGWQNSIRNEKTALAIYENRNHLSPRKLVTLAIPDFYGHTENNLFSRLLLKSAPEASGSIWRKVLLGEVGSVYHRVWAYVGLLPLLLAFAALLTGSADVKFWFLLGVSPLVLLFSLNFEFVHQMISSFWRGFESLDQMRTTVVYLFCFSVLAGFGLDAVIAGSDRLLRMSKWLLRCAVCFTVMLTAVTLLNSIFSAAIIRSGLEHFQAHRTEWLTLNPIPSFFEEGIRSIPDMVSDSLSLLWFPALLIFAFALSLRFHCNRRLSAAGFGAVALALVVLDLGYHGMNDPPLYYSAQADVYPASASIPSLDFLAHRDPQFRVLEIQQKKRSLELPLQHYNQLGSYRRRGIRYFDYDAFDFVARPDTLLYYGIASAGGYWSVYPVRFQQLWGGRTVDTLVYVNPGEPVDRWRGGWIDMQAIRFLLAAPGAVSNVYPAVYQGKDLTVFENRNALPRAFVVDQWVSIKDPVQLLKRIKSPSFDPRAVVLLEENAPSGVAGPGKLQWSTEIVERDPENLLIKVTTNKDAMLVLSDNDFPGWKAVVDGAAQQIYRANFSFRAVEVSAGSHEVRFEYDPPQLKQGGVLSIAALIFWLGGSCFLAYRQKRTTLVE
jgi:hypothetical protein